MFISLTKSYANGTGQQAGKDAPMVLRLADIRAITAHGVWRAGHYPAPGSLVETLDRTRYYVHETPDVIAEKIAAAMPAQTSLNDHALVGSVTVAGRIVHSAQINSDDADARQETDSAA